MLLSKSELERYSRHLLLPEMGVDGQKRLKSASVLVVGAGGLGSPLILYLAAAGIGKIGILDFDNVDKSNLQRQIIYRDDDVGYSKVQRAAVHANQLNPDIRIEKHETRIVAENAIDIISQYDLVVDGSDNFATRYLVNDACVFLKKANVHGAIYRFEGQASVFSHDDGPCYRCLFP
ncbi:MAG: HesA/MoeB/ThiF family protein, partial [Candidatus Obscuribacterales bacterium]|nr:HesA/MoeB/ThiF family protein [Candidatus Obscuribacterales bacterium]